MKRLVTPPFDPHRADVVDDVDSWPASTQAVYVSGGVWSTVPAQLSTPPPLSQPEAQRYQLTSLLGEGGMGQVWLGWDRRLQRHVAIKRPHGDHRPELAAQLTHEATLTARLEHPNIVSIYDVYTDDGRPHFVMRLVRGQPLARHITSGENLATLVRHLLTACEAIGHAHRRGTSHRDISPMNILISEEGSTHVIDWGFAATNDSLTELDDVIGTPGYTSPEQRQGRSLGPRSDVWSLGAILHCIITGEPPDTPHAAMPSAALAGEPELHAIAACALHPDPEVRYQDAAALAHDLQRWFEGHRVRAYHITPWRLLRHTLVQYRGGLALAALVLAAILAAISFGVINTRREAERARQAEDLAIAQRERAERSTLAAQSAAAQLIYQDASEMARQQDITTARALAHEALALEPGHPHSLGLLAALATRPEPIAERLGTLPECEGQSWLLGVDPHDALCHGPAGRTNRIVLAGWRMDEPAVRGSDESSPRGVWSWKETYDGEDPTSPNHACGMRYARSDRDVWRVASSHHHQCKMARVDFDVRSGEMLAHSQISGIFAESSDELRLVPTRRQLVDIPESSGICADKILNATRSPDGAVWLLCNTHEVWRLGDEGPERLAISPHDMAHSIVFADGQQTPWIASAHGKLFVADEGHISWDLGESVKEMRFLPGSPLLVMLGLRGKLRVFDTQARRWRFTAAGSYHDIAVDEGMRFRALRDDRTVIAWTFDVSPRIGRYKSPSGFATAAWSRNQDVIVGVDGDGRVHGFAPFAGRAWEPVPWFDKIGKGIAASSTGNDFAIVGIGARGVQRARIAQGELLIERDDRYDRHSVATKGVLLSPSRDALVLHYGLSDVVMHTVDGRPEKMFDLMGDHSTPHDADTSPDHGLVVMASASAVMRWDWQEGTSADLVHKHDDNVRAVSVDGRGEVLVTTKQGELLVFDEQLVLQRTWPIEGDTMLDVEWIPGSRVAAIAHLDGEMSVWNVDTGEVVMRGEQHAERVAKLDVSRDGRWMLSASWDGAIVVWDLDVALQRRDE